MAEKNFEQDSRIIVIGGEIDENLHNKVIESVSQLEYVSNEPIYMHINSFGGDVYSMLGIIDVMRMAKSKIITVCTGKAMSAAVPILAAGFKGERKIGKYATVMLHEVGSGSWGKLYEIKNDVKETERVQNVYIEILAEHTKQPISKLRNIFETHKDTYLSAKQSLELKIIDKII